MNAMERKNAECLACKKGQSTEEFCNNAANKGVVGCKGNYKDNYSLIFGVNYF